MANTLELGNGKWATGKDTVLAFNDENNNFKPLPFSFSRASSGTVINKDGLIETVGSGEPRIDFKDNTKGALLLEPERTNYVLKSNDFSLLSGGFVTPNYGTSPEGLSVSRILFTDANQSMSSSTSLSTGVVCNFSAYVKGIKGQFIKFAAGGVDIAHTFSGEWERLSGSATSINNSWNLNTYGYATARDFLLCGVQLEQGSYPTSYIPTSGSAVTRVADSTSQTPPSGIIGQTEGTVFLDFIRKPQSNNTSGLFGISSSNNADRVIIWNNFSLNSLGLQIKVNGGNLIGNQSLGNFDNDENYKIAISYKSGEIKAYVNGSSILNFTNSFTFANDINTIIVNSYQVGINSELSPFKDLKLYNTALTDQELIALTTI